MGSGTVSASRMFQNGVQSGSSFCVHLHERQVSVWCKSVAKCSEHLNVTALNKILLYKVFGAVMSEYKT
jgi:hypothetical protein